MRVIFSSVLLGTACLLSPCAQAQSWNTSSDVLALALPALAGTMAYQHQDGQGAAQLAWTLGSTLASTVILKNHTQQTRPDNSGNDSFPSGHTAVAFASARFIHKRYGAEVNPITLYGAAGLTALARVKADKHYWRDTVAGAALGYALAEYMTQTLEGDGIHLSPAPMGGLAVTWTQSW